MLNLPEDLLNELLEAYSAENEERLLRMTNLLIGIERQDLSEELHQSQLEEFYREIHNLKGASGTVGKTVTMQICQVLEDIYSSVKDRLLELEPAIIKATYDALTLLEQMANSDTEDQFEWQPLHEVLTTFVEDDEEDELFGFSDSFYQENSSISDLPVIDPQPNAAAQNLTAQPASPQKKQNDIEKSLPASDPLPKSSPKSRGFEAKPINNIRINVNRLEGLIEKTEELITLEQAATMRQEEIYQIREKLSFTDNWQKQMASDLETLRQCSREKIGLVNLPLPVQQAFERIQENLEVARTSISSIDDAIYGLQNLEKEFRQNQMLMIKNVLDEALGTAMLSFDEIFRGYPQLMRKLAQETGKKFTFSLSGETIEIDRIILDSLNDPIVHLLRNAVDHGMETPEERKHIGKPDTGHISLEARQKDAKTIEVVLTDDGKGLDKEKILQKAIHNNFCSALEASQLTDEEIYDYIFRSGFSTKETVTTVSGRGLGMAIVRDTIEKVGGKVFIETTKNQGSTFRLILPVSRTIFKGLRVVANNKQFVIPEESLELVQRIHQTDIMTTDRFDTILYKEKPIQIISLEKILNLPAVEKQKQSSNTVEFQRIVIVRYGSSFLAIEVDEILGLQEVVVRSMGSQLVNMPYVSGITVLGKGEIVPVLRISDIIVGAKQKASLLAEEATGSPLDNLTPNAPRTILVVDDSPTSRLLIKNIILGAGYQVLTAVDGREALAIAQSESIDLILTDIEMPRMDGFILSSTIRKTPGIEHLPIVLLTSLSSREDKEKGIDSGANAYIAKNEFDNDKMLEILDTLINR